MLDRLKTRVPRFREPLAEAIAWCSGQPVESDPIESVEILERRLKLGRKASELSRRAFLSSGPELWKSYQRRRARRLFERAKLENIKPLAQQLRSPVLDPGCICFPSGRFQQSSIVDQLTTRRAEQLRLEHRYPGDHPARDRRRPVVHPHRQLPPVHPADRIKTGARRQLGQHAASGHRRPGRVRSGRDLQRRGARVLRRHRLRHRCDQRRRGQEAAARPAAGHLPPCSRSARCCTSRCRSS